MIPLHLSGAVIAGIFVMLAIVCVSLLWVVGVIADEWREVEWHGEEGEK